MKTNSDQRIENWIREILEKSVQTDYLNIENESHNHSRAGEQTHFKIVIVSPDFKSMSMLKRHQWLNQLLIEVFKKVHALSVRTYDGDEWQKLTTSPISPVCAGSQNK